MELWQVDIVGGVLLADDTEAKVDWVGRSFPVLVIPAVVRRATGRAVCSAFAGALVKFGVPGEVLTDNGKQFTGRFTKPRPGEVLFERICRENGIVARNTKPRSPTTTGKVERFHQSLKGECLTGRIFSTVEDAQAAVDKLVAEYNYDRPHQGIDDLFPAQDKTEAVAPPLRIPSGLLPPTPPPPPVESARPGVHDSGWPVCTGPGRPDSTHLRQPDDRPTAALARPVPACPSPCGPTPTGCTSSPATEPGSRAAHPAFRNATWPGCWPTVADPPDPHHYPPAPPI
jgi:hypothetical protein